MRNFFQTELLRLVFGLGISIFVLSCSYDKTTLEVSSLFEPTWDFSESAKLSFDQNYVETVSGKTQLKSVNLTNSGADFSAGFANGVYFDGEQLSLQTNSFAELDSSWTSQFDNIVFYLKMDENWNDSSQGNNGTPVADAFITSQSKVGAGAGAFDGTGDRVDFSVPLSGVIDNLTMNLWVNWNGSTGGTNYLLYNGAAGSDGWGIDIRNAGGDVVSLLLGGVAIIDTADTLTPGTWNMVTFIRRQGTWEYYLNGVSRPFSSTATPLAAIGSPFVGSDFSGQLDDIAIWESPLTPQEVANIYTRQSKRYAGDTTLNSSWVPKYQNIIGYWKMDGNWLDSSSFGGSHTFVPGDNATFSLLDPQVGTHSGVFDGTSDYILASPSADFEINDNFSIAGWFKSDQNGSEQIIWAHRDLVNFEGMAVFVDNDTPRDYLSVRMGDGAAFNAMTGGDLYIDSDQWNHFVFIRNGGENTLLLNGQLQRRWSNTMLVAAGESPIMGARHSTALSSQEFDGELDEIAFWNQPLSVAEAVSIYQRQKQKYAGHYDSGVFDLGSSQSPWSGLNWSSPLAFGKELVGDFNNNGSPDNETYTSSNNIMENLSAGLVGYWSFNETSLDTIGGSTNDFADFSGSGFHADESGGVLLNVPSIFHSSVEFDGTDDEINIGQAVLPSSSGADPFTVSAWVRTQKSVGDSGVITQYASGNPDRGGPLRISSTGTVGYTKVGGFVATSSGTVNDGKWHHLVATKDSSGSVRLYIDSRLDGTGTDLLPFAATDTIIGSYDVLHFFDGQIDEVAIWDRALTANQVQQLYLRGAGRIKFQVKSCVDSSCACKSYNSSPAGSAGDCDGDTVPNASDLNDIYKSEFMGPGGDAATHYSELFNRNAVQLSFNCAANTADSNTNICLDNEISLLGSTNPQPPKVNYSHFPLVAKPSDNRYFQYRAYLEAEKKIDCSGFSCWPGLLSVHLGPEDSTQFYGGLQEVKPSGYLSYSDIISANIIADDCTTFQLSPNGSSYYYWDSTSWALASTSEQRSSKEDTEKNISAFASQFGPGQLYLKIFLQTNEQQTSNCTITSIDVESKK